MRKPTLFLSILAALMATACENDSEGVAQSGCSSSGVCEDGLICVSDACVPMVTEAGGDCSGSADLCAAPLVCLNDVCVAYHEKGETCSQYELCKDGLLCKDGQCSVSTDLGQSCDVTAGTLCSDGLECLDGRCVGYADANEACSDNILCTDGYFCHEGVCLNASEACSPGVVCKDSEICVANVCRDTVPEGGECNGNIPCEDGTSCIGKKCVADVGEGEMCDNAVAKCKAPLYCNMGICASYMTLGDVCDPFIALCEPGLTCQDNVCIHAVGLGETCENAAHIDCQHPLVCVYESADSMTGVCVEQVEMGGVCNEMNPCIDGGVCIMGTCLTKKGDCESDSDCSADTYCCMEEGCDVKNVCISYGSGPRGNTDETCSYETIIGHFEAAIQCEWNAPTESEGYANHKNVLMTPLVLNTPHNSGQANEIVFTSYNNSDGGAPSGQGSDPKYYGVIRIMNAETCKVHESIYSPEDHVIGGSNLSAADVDNDGFVEIFASRGQTHANSSDMGGIVAFHWNDESKKYEFWWRSSGHTATTHGWGGSAVHDINDDDKPEVIGVYGNVFDSHTGKRINKTNITQSGVLPTVADLDADGQVELIGSASVYGWDSNTNEWVVKYENIRTASNTHMAFADFGTPKDDGTFDYESLDGIAEVVGCGSGIVMLNTLQGKSLMKYTPANSGGGGGPCTVGDFDGDGLPEIATAFGKSYRVFDPRCTTAGGDCYDVNTLWSQTSQDGSSMSTGSSLFDFDGDGAMEAVYADECYTRVYDGKTGDVLFSAFRASSTWHENPVIADVDNDESAEIVVGSNNNIYCPGGVDPIHRGLRCVENSDCKSGSCVSGLCRCTENSQCNWRTDMSGNLLNEYTCTTGLTTEDQAGGNVCRARRDLNPLVQGVRVMRDSLDRWASSRSIWNQHAYSITNINDDQTIPKTSEWIQNFRQSNLNNYRQNAQGAVGRDTAPDITGYFINDDVCGIKGDKITVGAMVCNRGTKMVASKMPATFYQMNDDGTETLLCTSYTESNVPVGGCMRVSCEFTLDETGTGARKIRMVSNDDGNGGRTTVECNEQNNEDTISIAGCSIN